MRIIADHLKGATFLIAGGVIPGNKEHGYVLRRLLRRSAIKMYQLTDGKTTDFAQIADTGVLSTYDGTQGIEKDKLKKQVVTIIGEEIKKFNLSVARGLREIKKIEKVNGKIAFDLYQNFGFPYELTEELFREKGQEINKKQFLNEFNKHKELSRSSSVAKFKGGLADHSAQTIKYHTATHLLHQALFDVVGKDVRQEGSNITTERLRFDFASTIKPTKEQIEKVEKIINEKIEEKLSVEFKIIPKSEALKLGAKSFFREKYPDMVKVYFIGNYSKEFCGGPHVTNTFEIGKIMIYKFEKIGSNLYRIYAK
jgi:alanyl-tRNA synthetase